MTMQEMRAVEEFAREFLPDNSNNLAIRSGIVISVQADGTCTVMLSGTSIAIAGVRYLARCAPSAGKVCSVLKAGPDHLILGVLAVGAQFVMRTANPAVTNYAPAFSTPFLAFDGYYDCSLFAAPGDVIMYGISAIWGNEAVDGYLDVGTLVGASIIHMISGGEPAGIRAWCGAGGSFFPISGEVPYVVTATDLNGSLLGAYVTMRIMSRRTSATVKTLYSQVGVADFRVWARNIGPA